MSLWTSTAADLDVALARALERPESEIAAELRRMQESGEWDQLMAELEERIKPYRTKVTPNTMRRIVGGSGQRNGVDDG